MSQQPVSIEELSVNTVRMLAMDAIQKANSGHPGAAIALAPLAYTLFTRHLRYNPANADFPNRDRFVLSAGHASMLLYATLHLSGYDVSLDDIKAFRQLGSRTPGHPEHGCVPGVETTTGPLGQGAATSVGMAIAEKWLAAHFNRPEQALVDYRVYAVLGDGCMMEGITAEAASLAGHLHLDNLLWFYDSNSITIEGSTALALSEDVAKRFQAYGWHVQQIADVEDRAALSQAIDTAWSHTGQPSLIVVRSIIARGAPTKQNTAKAHGEPLGPEEIRAAKRFYQWDPDAEFLVPAAVGEHWTKPARERGAALEKVWTTKLRAYAERFPELAAQWQTLQRGELPAGWEDALPTFPPDAKGTATRIAGGKALSAASTRIPWLIGGAADLAPSTKTLLPDTGDFAAGTPGGRNLRFGIREHAMAAIGNGMALSKLRPFVATFLVFSDYARPAMRLSAMMHQPVIYVMTHDSIGVGEDGPTHQPVEHLAALRAIPNLDVFRPADANEAVAAWRHALTTIDRPTVLVLSRQDLPTVDRTHFAPVEGARRGGYIVADGTGLPQVILLGTGSELQHCLAAFKELTASGIGVRVVSLPCAELFDRQPADYRAAVLPEQVRARVAIEAGVTWGWHKYVGADGAVIGLDGFGLSAPYAEVMNRFGFTRATVVAAAQEQLRRHGR